MKKYILTGFDRVNNKMVTQIRTDIVEVFEVLDYFSGRELSVRYKTPRDLEFDCMSRKSHKGAVIIDDTQHYCWSICLID